MAFGSGHDVARQHDTVATFTPTECSGRRCTTYTATVSGAQDKFGQSITPYTYTFTTSQTFPDNVPAPSGTAYPQPGRRMRPTQMLSGIWA